MIHGWPLKPEHVHVPISTRSHTPTMLGICQLCRVGMREGRGWRGVRAVLAYSLRGPCWIGPRISQHKQVINLILLAHEVQISLRFSVVECQYTWFYSWRRCGIVVSMSGCQIWTRLVYEVSRFLWFLVVMNVLSQTPQSRSYNRLIFRCNILISGSCFILSQNYYASNIVECGKLCLQTHFMEIHM